MADRFDEMARVAIAQHLSTLRRDIGVATVYYEPAITTIATALREVDRRAREEMRQAAAQACLDCLQDVMAAVIMDLPVTEEEPTP